MDHDIQKLLDILEEDGKHLHALLARLTLREDVAEDLMQELFLKLRRTCHFLQANNPRAYVKRAAIHLAFDWRRRQRTIDVQRLTFDPEADSTSLLEKLVDHEEVEQILEALDHIPTVARDCVLLRYLQQEEYVTIAEHVGKTPHQVRALCYKAISRLRKQLRIVTKPSGGIHEG